MAIKKYQSCRRASVSLLFAIALVPLLMLVGLAIDFGFYNEAQTQLNLAADASAMHAARVAAALQQSNDRNFVSKGEYAGTQWFAAQEGTVPQAINGSVQPTVTVKYSESTNQITASVQYIGIIATHFAGLFPKSWPEYPNWGIAGAATAVISIPSYVEVQMLLDNSSSMLIGTTDSDILKMEELTPCSSQAANEGEPFDTNYSWAYIPNNGVYFSNPPASSYSATQAPNAAPGVFIPYGYGTFVYPLAAGGSTWVNDIIPTASQPVRGKCDSNFTGPTDECVFPATLLTSQLNSGVSGGTVSVNSNGQCTLNGAVSGGGPGSALSYNANTPVPAGLPTLSNLPQAPCGFACHNDSASNDYYGLAKANHVSLRYDVLQQAAALIISKMQKSATNGQLSVGVYQFNSPGTANSQPQGIQQVYPAPSDGSAFASSEAGQDWTTAESATQNVLPPVTKDQADTNFENAMTLLQANVKAAGPGLVPASPRKNLFIVTDGMDDYYVNANPNGQRVEGAITISPYCSNFSNSVANGGLGYTVYVLYIQYYPLPNQWYLNQGARTSTEPKVGSAVYNALQSCASSPSDFYVADGDATSITTALNNMLVAALNSPGHFSQ